MDWFRAYHSMSTDPKLHVIARAAKVPRGLIVGAWVAILSEASQASDRGDVSEVSPEALAYLIDVKPHVAKRIYEAIWASNLIADQRVAAWEKRQKISDDVQKRVSHHRAQKSNVLTNNETGRDGNVTKSARTEQNRTDIESSSSDDAGHAMNGHPHEPRQADIVSAFDDRFWPAYPRKKGKDAAKAKFIAKAKVVGVDAIMSGLDAAKAEWRRKETAADFIPHPATWLNQGRWSDEPDTAVIGAVKPKRRNTLDTEPGALYADLYGTN